MNKKLYDLCVKTGEYQTADGQTQPFMLNVGAVMQGDKGSYILIRRTFNPAGVPVIGKNCDSVMIELSQPKNAAQN